MRHLITIGILTGLALIGWRSPQKEMQVGASSFPWQPVGPNNLGHTLNIAIRAGNTLYIGSAFGGLFRSTDGGRSWSAVPGFNLNKNGENVWRCPSVTALASDGTNLYVGTAAVLLYNPAGISLTDIATTKGGVTGHVGRPGMGVFVSTDGGNSFAPAPATWRGNAISFTHSSRNWTVVTAMDAFHGKLLVATHESLYVSSDHLSAARPLRLRTRKPISSVCWGENDQTIFVTTPDSLFRSTNGGSSFQNLTPNLPLPPGLRANQLTGGNVRITRAPSDPKTLYVATANDNGILTGVWISRDNGNTWIRLCNPENEAFAVLGGLGFDNFALSVDPADPLRLVIGGLQLWEFSPGTGWRLIAPPQSIVSLPVPMRSVIFLDGGDLLVVGDGRPVRVIQGGQRIEDASRGIQATRILSVAVSPLGEVHASGPPPIFITTRLPKDPPGNFRLGQFASNFGLFPIGLLVSRLGRPGYTCFSYQAGRVRLSDARGENYTSIYGPPRSDAYYNDISSGEHNICPPGNPCASERGDHPLLFGPLFPPIAIGERFRPLLKDRNNQRSDTFFLFAATGGYLWTVTFDTLFRWNRVSSLRITNLTTTAATYRDYVNPARSIPTSMAVDSSFTVWIGTSDGKLYRVRNAHDVRLDRTQPENSLQDITPAIAGLIDGRWISAIAAHPSNPDLLAIATGSYSGPLHIFLSQNATSDSPTFTPIQADLPDVPVYALFFHPDSSHLLLAGTEWGLWRCQDVRNPNWEEITGEVIGRIPVTCITWKPYRLRVDTVDATNPDFPKTEEYLDPDPERPVFIGTWGRGIWKISSQYATSLPTATPTHLPLSIHTYPNPFTHDFTLEVQTAMPLRHLSYQLYTLTGARVHAYTYQNLTSGLHHISVSPGAYLSTGTYLLIVEALDSTGRRFQKTLKLVRP